MMKYLPTFLVMAATVACNGGGRRAGSEGGPCQDIGVCDDGLVCLSNLCVRPTISRNEDAAIGDAAAADLRVRDTSDATLTADRPFLGDAASWVTDQTIADLDWSPLAREKMPWRIAKDYCAAMGARLPTIDELRKIIINCPGSTHGGECRISQEAHRLLESYRTKACECPLSTLPHSALGDDNSVVLWSSSLLISPATPEPEHMWAVYFDEASVSFGYEGGHGNVRCVRGSSQASPTDAQASDVSTPSDVSADLEERG